MTARKRDRTGANAAIKVSQWIEPWGDSRFPIDVDSMAKNCHTTYGRDDPITEIHGAAWKEIDGFLRRNPDNPKEWWISYNTNGTPERQRFTKAHELGHYIIHSQRQNEFRCGRAAIVEKDTGETNIEAQANQFASYLLMPAKHISPRINNTLVTFDLVSELAGFYGVSFEAMCIRLVELSAERAVLVYWDNGMMRRWSRSEAAKLQHLWIDGAKHGPLEPTAGTLAADATVRQCPEGQMVPANLWFKTAPDGKMLREMKHTSDTYERVLSLLIVPKFESRWTRDCEGEDTYDTYDRFNVHGQHPVR